MKTLNKKIIFLIGFLLVILNLISNIANADCCMYPDELIYPTISITGVSVTNGIVTLSVSFTAGACIWYDKDGNITTIYYGEIYQLSLYIYSSDGRKFAERHVSIDHVYSGSDTLQWTSPSFAQDTYTIKVYARDTITISAPATVTVFVDNPLPRIISPADGSTVQGVGMYGVVDVTCEFFSPIGIRELAFEVWDGHYPLPKQVSTFGHMYSEPYPTSGTYTGQWQSASRPEGAYNFIVKATDCSGGLGRWGRSDPVNVILVKGPPTASFTYSPENPLINDEIRFDASLSYDDGRIVKYEWDFGDGVSVGSAEVRVVKHAYTQAGDYTVTLTVTDNDGMTGSVGRPVSVQDSEQMLKPVNGCVFSPLGNRMRNGKPDNHRGIDIVWPKPGDISGAVVKAPARGVVDNKGDDLNDGYWIRIKHRRVRRGDDTVAENVYTYYCHLLELPSLKVGSPVKQGDMIGQVGETGICDGPHLHFGVREGETIDDFVDPTKYLEYPGCKELRVEAHSPVDIRLVDPDGYIVSKTLIEIEMTATYFEGDFDGDGDLDDRIWLTDRKTGDYRVIVVPESGVSPSDNYTLEISADGVTEILAENVQVKDIPAQPYIVRSDENGFINIFWPVNIDIYPNRTPNQVYLSKNYTIYVVVLGSSDFNVTELDSTTVKFGRTGTEASPVRVPTIRDLNGDGKSDAMYGFMTFSCGFQLGDTEGVLTVKTTGGMNVIGRDSVLVSN